MYKNPFTPVFGSEPPFLGGRERLIGDVLKGLDNGFGNPNRITIFTGPRGSGKTVLLSRIVTEAEAKGWIGVQVSAETGMLADLMDQVEKRAEAFIAPKPAGRLTGFTVAGVGVTRQIQPEAQRGWRIQMEAHLDRLAERDVGLIFSIDEVKASVQELEAFISTFQFFIREKRNVALIMAGLPGNVLQMFQLDSISFLRRAFRRELNPIVLPEVRAVMRETIEMAARRIETPALQKAAEQTKGLAFVIQLIGYHVFNQSNNKMITMSDVDNGIIDAKADMESMILEATLFDLSDVDRQFLLAMAQDEAVSRIADIAERMGVNSQYADAYRRRLIARGIIGPSGRGRLVFAMPMLRELLIEKS
jgi:hypothetical protein